VCGAGKADVLQSAVGNGKNSDMLPVQTVSPEVGFKWFFGQRCCFKAVAVQCLG
jgi:6-phosphogluconolactonase/glucosamine-6-phosphate isomerase/deaminase